MGVWAEAWEETWAGIWVVEWEETWAEVWEEIWAIMDELEELWVACAVEAMFVAEAMGTCVGMVSQSLRNPCVLEATNVEEDMGACVAMEEGAREDGAL